VRLLLRACLAGSLTACGGANPLLHPAHALPAGQTAFGAGVSDRFVLGAERSALDAARARSANGAAPGDPSATRGLLVALAEGPALAPWVSARVGLPGTNEAGLSVTGQALRADARHAFHWGSSALSLGLGLSGRSLSRSGLDLPGTDLNRAAGFGLDLPLLFGYRTDADLISVWAGVRGSYDHWSGKVALEPGADTSLRATRWSGGPVLGLAVGVAPLYVAAELEADYARISGSFDGGPPPDASVSGWSLRPAGALIGKF
jgi:hypothetical protein